MTIGLSTTLAGCAPGSFTDRPATLNFASAGKPIETERVVLNRYHATDATFRDGLDPRSYRDSIVWQQIAADDESFYRFVRDIRSDRALMNMSADGGVIFLNGLAAVTGTAGEKAALSVLSGGLVAARGSVDKELFNLEAVSAVLARMKAARLAALVPIRQGLAQDIARYPLEQALVELRAYADAGSLLATIDAIVSDAGAVTKRAQEQQAEVRDAVYRDSRDAVDAFRARVKALTDNQAKALAVEMSSATARRSAQLKSRLADLDPRLTRFTNGANAKGYLIYWLDRDRGTTAELDDWARALDAAEKAAP